MQVQPSASTSPQHYDDHSTQAAQQRSTSFDDRPISRRSSQPTVVHVESVQNTTEHTYEEPAHVQIANAVTDEAYLEAQEERPPAPPAKEAKRGRDEKKKLAKQKRPEKPPSPPAPLSVMSLSYTADSNELLPMNDNTDEHIDVVIEQRRGK
jgi:hypothetical protein